MSRVHARVCTLLVHVDVKDCGMHLQTLLLLVCFDRGTLFSQRISLFSRTGRGDADLLPRVGVQVQRVSAAQARRVYSGAQRLRLSLSCLRIQVLPCFSFSIQVSMHTVFLLLSGPPMAPARPYSGVELSRGGFFWLVHPSFSLANVLSSKTLP